MTHQLAPSGRLPRARFEARREVPAGIDVAALGRLLCELGRVRRLEDLGTNGPLLASAGSRSLFHTLFGRDAIRMAMDLLDDFPTVARSTILELARFQGVETNPRAEEQPGRILHEYRHPDDPHAVRLADWDFPYYGAVDATPLWINLLFAYCQRVLSSEILDQQVIDRSWRTVTVLDSLLAAIDWMLRRIEDPRAGGYLWVQRASPHSILNQVWEDSHDSHYHADGTLFSEQYAYAPVAVQGYTYDALLSAADLLDDASVGRLPADTGALRRRADDLRNSFLSDFWQPDLGTFAQALTFNDPQAPQSTRVVASSPGHLLASRLLDGPDAQPIRDRLIARLFEPDLLAAAGIRTKSTTAARYRAGAYHNGSSWPMDTGVIADGLRRHGYPAEADDLDCRILRACANVGGFPEFFRGDADQASVNTEIIDTIVDGVSNRLEQPPQANQGWTMTRVWRILRSTTGH